MLSRLMESVPKGDRHLYRKILELVSIAPIPPNLMMLSQILKTPHWKVKGAIKFWRSHGMIKIEKGMLYSIGDLN